MYGAWRDKYLDYNGLKTELKRRTVRGSWSDQDENEFTKILDVELKKIQKFQSAKVIPFLWHGVAWVNHNRHCIDRGAFFQNK